MEVCLALASVMVPCPRAEASLFWGLVPPTDSESKVLVPLVYPHGQGRILQNPSRVLKDVWVLQALRSPGLLHIASLC